MCTQLNEVPEGKRFNWVLCFLNEPFPGWAKSDHLLLVSSHLALRDNPYPNTQSATISSLIISGDILLWFDLLDKAVKKVLLASLNLLPLFTKHLPRISAICGMMSRDHWRLLYFLLPRTKERTFCSVSWFFHELLLLEHFCMHTAVTWTQYDKQDGCPLLSFSQDKLPWHFKFSFFSLTGRTNTAFSSRSCPKKGWFSVILHLQTIAHLHIFQCIRNNTLSP